MLNNCIRFHFSPTIGETYNLCLELLFKIPFYEYIKLAFKTNWKLFSETDYAFFKLVVFLTEINTKKLIHQGFHKIHN